MDEKRTFEGFTEEQLAEYGYSAGRAVAVLVDSFIQGLADGRAELAAPAGGVELVQEDTDEETYTKTERKDCRACWCDACAKIEDCQQRRDGARPDGIRPFPCIGCLNGMRFKPREEEPCEEYEQAAGYNNG